MEYAFLLQWVHPWVCMGGDQVYQNSIAFPGLK